MSKKSGKTIALAVIGASGRMGREICTLAQENKKFDLAAEVSGSSWKIKNKIDVAIEFSSPAGLLQSIEWCVQNKVPLVSGTTGLGDVHKKQLKAAAQKIPLLYSANMSLGIAVMTAMLEPLRAVEDWDFQIEEAHHALKKDKPSGTALLLDQKLSSVLGRKLPPTNSVRGGGIPGIHQVWAMGPEEVLTIQHTAFHRKVFARGALRAALWLFDKGKPGLYDLSDLYKVN